MKYLVDSPIKYALFRKQVSSPPKRLFIQHQTIRQIVSCIFVCSLCHITWTREFQANEFVRSKNIIPIVDAINEENENCEIPNSLGRKCPLKEMSKYQCGIAELDYEIPELEGNKNYLNSFVPWYPPLPASFSSSSLNNECYKDTRNISGSSSPCSTSSPCSPCSNSSFLQPTYQPLLKSMCVSNWVLLHFKLQAKLPDAARQTLLKLTQLGRCGIKDLL